MMKIFLRNLAFTFVLLAGGLMAKAQLFPQPQPLMYDRGYDAYLPSPKLRRVVFSRYIAGARFPKDWDVVVESYAYDPKGGLTHWNRYQNITGEPTLQNRYTWNADGTLQNETILLASDHSEIIRNYVWQKDASGKPTMATIEDKNKKPIAKLEIQPNGGYLHTDISLGNGKELRSTYNAAKMLVRTENTGSGLVEEYAYSPTGLLASVTLKEANGKVTKIEYTNKLDDKGRIISQTESGRGNPKTFYFKYDDAGHMVERGIIANQPTELRNYDPLGRLTNILYFDPLGFPKEVLNISYETY